MNRRYRILLLVLLIVVFGGASAYLLGTPRLVDIRPEPGATEVPAGTSLQLTFSRPMRETSLQDKLSIQPPREGSYSWDGRTLSFTPNRPWPNGEIVQLSLSPGVRAAGWLSLPTQSGREWSMTIEKPFLLYLFPANSPAAIYALNPGSGQADRLSEIPGEIFDYSVDASGMSIIFSASRTSGGSSLFQLDRLSGENRLLIDFPDAQVRYSSASPDGAFLAYERTGLGQGGAAGPPQIWVLPQSSDPPVLGEPFAAGEAGHKAQAPSWSPAGLLTFYDSTLSAFVIYDPRSRQSQTIPSQTGQAGVWDPTGRWFVFPEILPGVTGEAVENAGLQPIPTSHLMRYDRVDKRLRDLTLMDDLEDASPVFSPDGNTLVFARKYLGQAEWTPGRQIWLMDADGTHARQLTREPQFNHYDFSWSPDGTQIAYVRFDQTLLTEPPEVWTMGAGGSSPQQVVTGGFAPQWIP